jgi:hypothetical protein
LLWWKVLEHSNANDEIESALRHIQMCEVGNSEIDAWDLSPVRLDRFGRDVDGENLRPLVSEQLGPAARTAPNVEYQRAGQAAGLSEHPEKDAALRVGHIPIQPRGCIRMAYDL